MKRVFAITMFVGAVVMAVLFFASSTPAQAAWSSGSCTTDPECTANYGPYSYCSGSRCFISCSFQPEDGDAICHNGTGINTSFCENHLCQYGPTPPQCPSNCTQLAGVLAQCATGTMYYNGFTYTTNPTGGTAGGTCFVTNCRNVTGIPLQWNGLSYCDYPAWPATSPVMTLNPLPADIYTTLGSIKGTATDAVGVVSVTIAIRKNAIGGACTAGVTESWNGSTWDSSGNGCNAYITVPVSPPSLSYSLNYPSIPSLPQMTDGAEYRVYARAMQFSTGRYSPWATAGPTIFHSAQNAPTGTVSFSTADCNSNIVGTASDIDSPNTALTIKLYIDGVATTKTTLTLPGVGGNSFLFASPLIKDGLAHTYTAYAYGVNAAASQSTPDAFLAPVPIAGLTRTCNDSPTGAIISATCGSVSGTAADLQGPVAGIEIWEGTAPDTPNVRIGGATGSPFVVNFPTYADGISHTFFVNAMDVPSGVWSMVASQTIFCAAPPPTVTITANPAALPYMTGSSNIAWSSTNATGCTATDGSGLWAANRSTSGTFATGALPITTTYTITCTGSGGSATKSATVTVSTPPPPTISGVTQPNYCSAGMPAANVNWTTSIPVQSYYQLQVATTPSFAIGTIAYDSGKTANPGNMSFATASPLEFGKTYYARVQVWDANDNATGWSANSSPIVMPLIAYPTVVLSVTPEKPIALLEAIFSDDTDYKGATVLKRVWDFGDGTIVTENNPATNTISHTYADMSPGMTAVLSVSAAGMLSGESCKASLSISVKKALPIFKEVRP